MDRAQEKLRNKICYNNSNKFDKMKPLELDREEARLNLGLRFGT